jgi:hypothetical protein
LGGWLATSVLSWVEVNHLVKAADRFVLIADLIDASNSVYVFTLFLHT